MEEQKNNGNTTIHNHFAEGSNCQVFNAPISNAIFAMPGSHVTQVAAKADEQTKSEAEMMEAIRKVMEERNAKGDYIWRDSEQWYAVFRVLSSCCGYPTKAKDFERVMKNLGADDLRLPCKYDNFRKITLHQLPQDVKLWKQYKHTADQYSLKQVEVAVRLMAILGIE